MSDLHKCQICTNVRFANNSFHTVLADVAHLVPCDGGMTIVRVHPHPIATDTVEQVVVNTVIPIINKVWF